MAYEQYAECTEACEICADACDHCATACLAEDDVGTLGRCISLDLDCAQVCRLAAGAMSRDSELVRDICTLCAEICEVCGDECASHEHEHCRECAEACRQCADACRQMLAGIAAERAREGARAGAH